MHAVWYAFVIHYLDSFYIQNFKPLASLCSWAGWFESYRIENPEDRFSCDVAHLELMTKSHLEISAKNKITRKDATHTLPLNVPKHSKTNKMTVCPAQSDQSLDCALSGS